MSATPPVKSSYFSIPSDPSFIHPITDFPPLSIFESKIPHAALIIPAKRTAELRNLLRDVLLHRPKTKSIYSVEGRPEVRKMVLRKKDDDVLQDPVVVKLLADNVGSVEVSSFSLEFNYPDWNVDEALHKILPFEEVPSSFEIVGHIAHVNLKDEWLPFQFIIGKVFLDKNKPRIKTVVNKEGQIDTKYRTFGMKVIAGEAKKDWSIVKMKEEGCQFELDFTKVYWNSRLGGEHRRVVQHIIKKSPGCCVADIMAGVGPFAVPLTSARLNKTKIIVHANDLNPSSFEYLKVNMNANKCDKTLHPYNMDGRAFVHHLQDEGIEFAHAIMNLPATAPEFMDAFRGFTNKTLPEIHVHCFGGKDEGGKDEVVARCSKALGCPILEPQVHLVRNVAPKKNMFCVSFVLPEAARSLERITIISDEEDDSGAPEAKKARIEE